MKRSRKEKETDFQHGNDPDHPQVEERRRSGNAPGDDEVASWFRLTTALRTLSTSPGDLELRIPKLRSGSFFPALLERRRRVDQCLFAVVMEAYLHGTSTRKVDDLVKALGADSGISKSKVSWICKDHTLILDRKTTMATPRRSGIEQP